MSSVTPNYGLILPGVNDPTDQDLWGGYLNTDLTTIDTTMKAISDAAEAAGRLPVGSLYFNATDATNPASLLGYGTWTAFGQGRVILGVGTGTDGNGDQLIVAGGATGGEYEHTLTIAEMPLHGHPWLNASALDGDANGGLMTDNDGVQTQRSAFSGTPSMAAGQAIGGAGGDDPHNNIQPYIGVYIWKRTA